MKRFLKSILIAAVLALVLSQTALTANVVQIYVHRPDIG